MTGFPTAARRARDPRLSLDGRLWNLKVCTKNFAPYGFRATWHHLLAAHPGSPLGALEELEEAWHFFIGYREAVTARRKHEKARGRRCADEADRWLLAGIRGLAYCPDPELHPTGRLKAVTELLIGAYTSTADWTQVCPLCRTARRTQPCPGCGVELRAHLAFESRAPHPDRRLPPRPRFRDGRLAALRLGRRLVMSVPAAEPACPAFVDIVPAQTDADRAADREGWTRTDTNRAFVVSHWHSDDRGGARMVRTARATDERALMELLHRWGLDPAQFDYPWQASEGGLA